MQPRTGNLTGRLAGLAFLSPAWHLACRDVSDEARTRRNHLKAILSGNVFSPTAFRKRGAFEDNQVRPWIERPPVVEQ